MSLQIHLMTRLRPCPLFLLGLLPVLSNPHIQPLTTRRECLSLRYKLIRCKLAPCTSYSTASAKVGWQHGFDLIDTLLSVVDFRSTLRHGIPRGRVGGRFYSTADFTALGALLGRL